MKFIKKAFLPIAIIITLFIFKLPLEIISMEEVDHNIPISFYEQQEISEFIENIDSIISQITHLNQRDYNQNVLSELILQMKQLFVPFFKNHRNKYIHIGMLLGQAQRDIKMEKFQEVFKALEEIKVDLKSLPGYGQIPQPHRAPLLHPSQPQVLHLENISFKNPPFFKIKSKLNDREIYILGSHHVIKLDKILHPSAIKELKDLEQRNAILFTEHELTNKAALEAIHHNENLIAEDENPFEHLGISPMYFEKIKDIKILIDPHNISHITFKDILRTKLWLFSDILGTHTNLCIYKNFGGTEYDMEYGGDWHWGDIKHLEDPAEMIRIAKDSQSQDTLHNKQWAKDSFTQLMMLQTLSNTEIDESLLVPLKADFIRELEKSAPDYSWEVIKERDIVNSAFERNKAWVRVIKDEVIKPHDPRPILIIVGDGHLKGSFMKSFLFLLTREFNNNTTYENFHNDAGWRE